MTAVLFLMEINPHKDKLCFVVHRSSSQIFNFKIQATSTDKPVSPNYALGNGVGTGGKRHKCLANPLIRLGFKNAPAECRPRR